MESSVQGEDRAESGGGRQAVGKRARQGLFPADQLRFLLQVLW